MNTENERSTEHCNTKGKTNRLPYMRMRMAISKTWKNPSTRKRWMGEIGEFLMQDELNQLGHELATADEVHPDGLPSGLKKVGGKRPDLYLAWDNRLVVLDAKLHSVGTANEFWLSDAELAKYDALVSYLRGLFPDISIIMAFYVLPTEHAGSRAVCVSLKHVHRGIPKCRVIDDVEESGKAVALSGLRKALWSEIAPEAVQRALDACPAPS